MVLELAGLRNCASCLTITMLRCGLRASHESFESVLLACKAITHSSL